jgi:hypothetical protein
MLWRIIAGRYSEQAKTNTIGTDLPPPGAGTQPEEAIFYNREEHTAKKSDYGTGYRMVVNHNMNSCQQYVFP